MILGLTVFAALAAILLAFVTLVQMLYMDSQRLRAKEMPMLTLFREELDERIGLKTEDGILSFSVVKHTLLALLGPVIFCAATYGGVVTAALFIETALITWVVMIIAAYLVPQFLYRHTSGSWMVGFAGIIRIVALVARPVTASLGFLQSLAQLGNGNEDSREAPTAEENIEALITAGTEEGIIEEDDRKLIQSVVAFGNKTVREVMTPRPDMVSVSAESSLEDLRQLVIHEQFSRIPVYEDGIDQIVGFVHVRDMFELDYTERAQQTVRDVMRPMRFVPETKPVNDLMREMQADGAHMAVVIDEYGNTAGLVTMEDMVEEIVGEIRDEHEPGMDVERDADGGFIVSGSFDLDHVPDLLHTRAPQETESTTIGGLVTEWMGKVPEAGDSVERDGIRIEVLAANELRVDQVRISKASRNGHE